MSGDYNFYRYVSNDPANNLDALGLAKCNQKKLEKKLNQAKAKVSSKLKSLNKFKSMAAKKAAKKVATLPLKTVPFLGWAMAAYDVYDTVTTGIDIYDMVKEYDAAADAVEEAGKKLADCKKASKKKTDGTKIEKKKAPSKRNEYMGKIPGKKSRTGKEVIERMKKEGKIRGTGDKMKFKSSNGKWYSVKEADMAHKTDAVSWWNKTGREFGAKSKEVRKFMLDSKNYELEHFSINRSQGARLGETYLPPLK